MNLEEIKQYIKENGLDVKTKRRPVVYRRSYLMNYMEKELRIDRTMIGIMFNLDRTTVIHGIENIYNRYKNDKIYIGYITKEIHELPLKEGGINLPNNNLVLVELNSNEYKKLQFFKFQNDIWENQEAIKKIINESI